MYIICVNLDSCHQINLTGCAKVFIFYMNRAKVFQGHAAIFFREKGKSPEIPVTNHFPLAWFVFIHTLSCLFWSVVYNCSVQWKVAVTRFVLKQNFCHAQLVTCK